MKKTIEDIWKEGFPKSEAFIVPKLSNLYNQKSIHIVDNLISLARKNIIGIIIGAFVLLALSIIFKAVAAGTILFLILMWLAFYTKKLKDRMQEIDKGLNAYQYIKALDRWLKDRIADLTKMNRVLYPTILCAFSIGLWRSSFGQMLFERTELGNPDSFMIWGIPGYWLLGTIIGVVLMSLFAGPLYRFDVKMVYGRVLEKLEAIIADMEELRKPKGEEA
jgi:hypothetical protein